MKLPVDKSVGTALFLVFAVLWSLLAREIFSYDAPERERKQKKEKE